MKPKRSVGFTMECSAIVRTYAVEQRSNEAGACVGFTAQRNRGISLDDCRQTSLKGTPLLKYVAQPSRSLVPRDKRISPNSLACVENSRCRDEECY